MQKQRDLSNIESSAPDSAASLYIGRLCCEENIRTARTGDVTRWTQSRKRDFNESMQKVEDLNKKIMCIRHARNKFNIETKLKNGMTVDQALIKLAMLNKCVEKIKNMSTRQEKSRVRSSGFSARSNEIEYQYINYNLDDAKGKYEEIVDEIMNIQEELNLINTTLVFDVDINL